jgi:uncharacterized caspase-like protein
MRVVAAVACALMMMCLGTGHADIGGSTGHAEKRVALVVGNDRYANLPPDQQLRNAVNDARAVGDALEKLGFDVIRGENLNRQGLVDSLDRLTARLAPGDTAFFFFSGHGVAIGGGNYILPSDVPDTDSGQETRLARAALGENDIVTDLQGRGVRVAVVVLDACRNNPFRRPGGKSVGGEKGLARTEPVRGVFSLYAAGIGQTALDRLGEADSNPNSVFTRVLVPALTKPGLDLGGLAVEVREEVARLASTVGRDQRPAYYDETIGGRVYLAASNFWPPPPIPQQLDAAPVVATPVPPALLGTKPTDAGRRVALVIGNSAYKAVPALSTPKKDALGVAEALRAAGFASVQVVTDVTRDGMIRALRDFQDLADTADWAVVYYAGHGIAVGGADYLIPTDARLKVDRDAQDEAISLNRVLNAVAGAKKLNLVMLDACRDNPFARWMRITTRGEATRGLTRIEPEGATLVVFAAKDGEVAVDDKGEHSPFTAALINRLPQPGVEINRLFRLVTGDVLKETGNRQRPFVYGSNPGEEEFYFSAK